MRMHSHTCRQQFTVAEFPIEQSLSYFRDRETLLVLVIKRIKNFRLFAFSL